MFWQKEYTTSIKIADDLRKENITLKELLEDHDILQEFRSQNKYLMDFLKRDGILEELVELITKEPPNDVPEVERFRYSTIACEILTSNQPSLVGQLVVRQNILEKLYAFLEQEPPLNPLLCSFFAKTFGMLISKQQEQDWFSYQCVCLQVLEFIKSREGFLDSMYKHIGTTAIMDLLFHIVTDVKGPPKSALFEWLREQELIHRLIDILGNDCDTDKHNNVAQLICDLITTGRTERQSVLQEPSSAESIVSDILINALEDASITRYLLDIILAENAKESTIVSGIQILLSLLENPIINEPVSDTALQYLVDAETDHHQKIIGTILHQISPKIANFHALLLNPPKKPDIQTTVTLLSPPFGITRLSVCTLFTVLIETKNPLIIQSICETDFFNTLLKLFKQYCWNNILHNQVKKCVMCAFKAFDQTDGSTNLTPSALQKHIIVNCKIVSKLIDCWMHNKNKTQSSDKKGCRVEYMGHLIEMFDLLVSSMLASDQFRALVESNIDEQDQDNWNTITHPETGELAKELRIQRSFLANIDPAEYSSSMQKDFLDETLFNDFNNETESNLQNSVDDLANSLYQANLFEQSCNNRAYASLIFGDSDIWDDESSSDLASDLQNNLKLEYNNSVQSSEPMQIFNQWDIQNNMNAINDTEWATFSMDNFADFDQHFNAFTTQDFPSVPDTKIDCSNNGSSSSSNNSNCMQIGIFSSNSILGTTNTDQITCSTTATNGTLDGNSSNNHSITSIISPIAISTEPIITENQSSTNSEKAIATAFDDDDDDDDDDYVDAADDANHFSGDNFVMAMTTTKSDKNANDVLHSTVFDVTEETDHLNLINSFDAKPTAEQSSLANDFFNSETAFLNDATSLNFVHHHNSPWNIHDADDANHINKPNDDDPFQSDTFQPTADGKLIDQPKFNNLKLSNTNEKTNNTTTNNTDENLIEQQQTNGPA